MMLLRPLPLQKQGAVPSPVGISISAYQQVWQEP